MKIDTEELLFKIESYEKLISKNFISCIERNAIDNVIAIAKKYEKKEIIVDYEIFVLKTFKSAKLSKTESGFNFISSKTVPNQFTERKILGYGKEEENAWKDAAFRIRKGMI